MDGFPPKILIKSETKALYAKIFGHFRTSDILRGTTHQVDFIATASQSIGKRPPNKGGAKYYEQKWLSSGPYGLQLPQHLLGYTFQRIKDSITVDRHGFKMIVPLGVQLLHQLIDGNGVRHIPLVPLHDERDFLQIQIIFLEVVVQVVQGFNIGVKAR